MDGLIRIVSHRVFVFPLIIALIAFYLAHKWMGG